MFVVVQLLLDYLFQRQLLDFYQQLQLGLGVRFGQAECEGRQQFLGWEGLLFAYLLPLFGDQFVDLVEILLPQVLELHFGHESHRLNIHSNVFLQVLTELKVLNVLDVLVDFAQVGIKQSNLFSGIDLEDILLKVVVQPPCPVLIKPPNLLKWLILNNEDFQLGYDGFLEVVEDLKFVEMFNFGVELGQELDDLLDFGVDCLRLLWLRVELLFSQGQFLYPLDVSLLPGLQLPAVLHVDGLPALLEVL